MDKEYKCKHSKHGFEDCSDCRLDRDYGASRSEKKEPKDLVDDLHKKKMAKLHDVCEMGGGFNGR